MSCGGNDFLLSGFWRHIRIFCSLVVITFKFHFKSYFLTGGHISLCTLCNEYIFRHWKIKNCDISLGLHLGFLSTSVMNQWIVLILEIQIYKMSLIIPIIPLKWVKEVNVSVNCLALCRRKWYQPVTFVINNTFSTLITLSSLIIEIVYSPKIAYSLGVYLHQNQGHINKKDISQNPHRLSIELKSHCVDLLRLSRQLVHLPIISWIIIFKKTGKFPLKFALFTSSHKYFM